MPAGRTLVCNVGGGDGMTVHGHRGSVPRVDETVDPLPLIWIKTYLCIDVGTQTAYAWNGAGNRPELVAGQ